MPGWLTSTLPDTASVYGAEKIPLDTQLPGGQFPQTERISLIQMATAMLYLGSTASKTTVAGTRYYSSWNLNAPNPAAADGGAVEAAPLFTATGIAVAIGSTGGTDLWNAELHDAAGVTLATSLLTGTTAGTANTWQQLAFTATIVLPPAMYFLVVQSNGTTAHPLVYNFPAPVMATTPLITGSATGTLGTAASFTPATTYTANLGPVAMLY